MSLQPQQIYIDHIKNTSPSKSHHQISTVDLPANTQSNFIIMLIHNKQNITSEFCLYNLLYRITMNILTTICNTRSLKLQSTSNCTYKPFWRL